MNKNVFTHKLSRLLLIQALRSQEKNRLTGNRSDWCSVGGILGSGEYQNHLEQMWVDSDKKLSTGKLADEKEDL